MFTLLVILILIACILLVAVVLIQNPKGGGLSQSFGGFSNQIMGVQRTTDFLEKATWGLISVIAILSLFTAFLADNQPAQQTTAGNSVLDGIEAPNGRPMPAANQAPQGQPAQAPQGQPAPAQQQPAQDPPANKTPAK